MKLLTCIGARPQFIKAATVSRAVSAYNDVHEVIVHTGQHYDVNMSDVFFEELSIPKPDHHLALGGGNHGEMTGRMLGALEAVMIEEKPDMVLVYGDTNSTLAGALAAVKLHLPVAHVEAGLRSFNRRMPEEINRILTDHASDILFVPTKTALKNLEQEGLPEDRVHFVGDVMYDAALFYRALARSPAFFSQKGVEDGNFILATIHRAENTDDPKRLAAILCGLGRAGRCVVLPLHPRTRQRIKELGIAMPASMLVTEPVSYLEMVWLEAHAAVIATDSGGVQKEAFFHETPCVTMRDETEWVELVEAGWNRLVGADENRIVEALNSNVEQQHRSAIYGAGDASNRIVELIRRGAASRPDRGLKA
ncbi:MAG: UDP-N-acetylglucosamine 2-epimerase (non-hydrolyzing) [Rhizobiaceae bacterium]|nr:UDP-N-acetylglucosamine 2-epimerase (non-hydrolyzing) [Rhizobiaceae bacterium]